MTDRGLTVGLPRRFGSGLGRVAQIEILKRVGFRLALDHAGTRTRPAIYEDPETIRATALQMLAGENGKVGGKIVLIQGLVCKRVKRALIEVCRAIDQCRNRIIAHIGIADRRAARENGGATVAVAHNAIANVGDSHVA